MNQTAAVSPPSGTATRKPNRAAVWKARDAHRARQFARLEAAHVFSAAIAIGDGDGFLAEQWHNRAKVAEFCSAYERHRIAEAATADYFRKVLLPRFPRGEYLRVAERLESCRCEGCVGLRSDGRVLARYQDKCGQVRLCPDEARAEAQRLRASYEPGILRLVRERGGRIYRAVFTLPNYPAGRLAEGKRYIYKRFRDRIIRSRKGGKARFPILGALVVQEDPLSASGDWNIHLNVVLVCSGFLDFGELRDAWAANLHIAAHPPNYSDSAMARLWAETIKYAVRTVPEKSQAKAGEGSTAAPAFIDWPPERADEWMQAHKVGSRSNGKQSSFRRTRAYGRVKPLSREIQAAKKLLAASDLDVRWHGVLTYRNGRARFRPTVLGLDLIRANSSPTVEDDAGDDYGTGPPPVPDPGGNRRWH